MTRLRQCDCCGKDKPPLQLFFWTAEHYICSDCFVQCELISRMVRLGENLYRIETKDTKLNEVLRWVKEKSVPV